MDNPRSGLTWVTIHKDQDGSAGDLLRRMGRGQIDLTHEAFHALQPWRAAAHLRELLMACGVLPTLDKQICSFERWLVGHLAGIENPCLLYTSDAADEEDSVDLGGRRIIKK